MKRFFIALIVIITIFSLCACTQNDHSRADEHSRKFISALLLRDEDAMRGYIHPDYVDVAMPNDEFYETLEKQYLTVGHELTNLSAVGKAEINDMDGDALKCTYIARVNELFYTVELIIIDNENGYGVVSAAMVLNIELDYYYHESDQGD